MKRSKTLTLTAAMVVGGGMTLSACGQPSTPITSPTESASAAAPPAAEGERAYATLEECRQANEQEPGACDAAWSAASAEHANNAPRFANRAECEAQFGAEQCQPRGNSFVPFLAGFFIANALTGNRYGGRAFYRDPTGRAVTRDGRPLAANAFQPRRTSAGRGSTVTSRGGYGGAGGRSYGG